MLRFPAPSPERPSRECRTARRHRISAEPWSQPPPIAFVLVSTNGKTLAAAVVRPEVLDAISKQNISSAAVQQFCCIPIEPARILFLSETEARHECGGIGEAASAQGREHAHVAARPDLIDQPSEIVVIPAPIDDQRGVGDGLKAIEQRLIEGPGGTTGTGCNARAGAAGAGSLGGSG
jgi:hypothetical protein